MALDFLINIPIGMLGFWAAAKVMGNHKGNANKLDWTGFFTLCIWFSRFNARA